MISRRNFLSVAGGGAAVLLVSRDLFASGVTRGTKAVVYLSPSCGCCAKWVKHMETSGFDVEVRKLDDVNPVKREHKVPEQLWSCHTALVGGYVVEGHVPADLVTRLLRVRSAVAGLAVAGMPTGAPGMEMEGRKDAYDVVEFTHLGETKVFAKR
jgi:hypothetical protein